MTTIKAYTDIQQSEKLAEILPLESADMYYWCGKDLRIGGHKAMDKDYDIPCWSLTALLDNIPQVKLDSIKPYDYKYWRCCAYLASGWHNSDWCYNPIDACYEMILKLHEQNLI